MLWQGLRVGIFAILVANVIKAHVWSPAAYCERFQRSNLQPRTCLDHLCEGRIYSGGYGVNPTGFSGFSVYVYCDQTTDGGGWTVFQRRMDGSVNFYQKYRNYKLGFGNVKAGEFWLGNDNIHMLTNLHHTNELRVDMESVSNEKTFAHYGNFSVASETDGYRLTVGGFLGTSVAGDALTNSNGMRFTTRDRDQDIGAGNCAETFKGGWWYRSCHQANLNGLYHEGSHESFADGVNWKQWKGYHESLTWTEMKFRPVF